MTTHMNTKILVTGGTGFLGRRLVARLEASGYQNVNSFSSRSCDLTSRDATMALFDVIRPEVVIHLAAKVGGILANRANPGKFAYANLAMGINILEACREHQVEKCVIAGTICAYPKFTPVPFKEESLWDGYPEETNAPYGLAKKMLLVMAQGYRQQYRCNFVYLLPVNLYGPGDNFHLENSHVIPAMIRKFHEAKLASTDVTLWGDGSPTREFLYVDDCADAFVSAMERYDGADPINVGTGIEISMMDLAEKIRKVVGFEGEIHWDSSKPNGQPRRCLDVSRAKERLLWEAKMGFDDGLARTYEWFKSQ